MESRTKCRISDSNKNNNRNTNTHHNGCRALERSTTQQDESMRRYNRQQLELASVGVINQANRKYFDFAYGIRRNHNSHTDTQTQILCIQISNHCNQGKCCFVCIISISVAICHIRFHIWFDPNHSLDISVFLPLPLALSHTLTLHTDDVVGVCCLFIPESQANVLASFSAYLVSFGKITIDFMAFVYSYIQYNFCFNSYFFIRFVESWTLSFSYGVFMVQIRIVLVSRIHEHSNDFRSFFAPPSPIKFAN